jgi:uncharacterized protein (DUF433 family)
MAKTGTSIRLRPDLKEALERHARALGTSTAALYERFLDEGLRRDDHPLITFRDGAGGRRATVAATRLTVAQVIDTLQATEGDSDADRVRDTAEYLDIPISYVTASVRYYAAFQAEVDAWRAAQDEAAERARENWEREQAVFS